MKKTIMIVIMIGISMTAQAGCGGYSKDLIAKIAQKYSELVVHSIKRYRVEDVMIVRFGLLKEIKDLNKGVADSIKCLESKEMEPKKKKDDVRFYGEKMAYDEIK